MSKEEAISHIVASTNYWKGDTIDNSYYPNNLGLKEAFRWAVYHVKNSHGAELDEKDIRKAKELVGLSNDDSISLSNLLDS